MPMQLPQPPIEDTGPLVDPHLNKTTLHTKFNGDLVDSSPINNLITLYNGGSLSSSVAKYGSGSFKGTDIPFNYADPESTFQALAELSGQSNIQYFHGTEESGGDPPPRHGFTIDFFIFIDTTEQYWPSEGSEQIIPISAGQGPGWDSSNPTGTALVQLQDGWFVKITPEGVSWNFKRDIPNGPSIFKEVNASYSFQAQQWYHVAIVYIDSSIDPYNSGFSIFINGQPTSVYHDDDYLNSEVYLQPSTGVLTLGGRYGSSTDITKGLGPTGAYYLDNVRFTQAVRYTGPFTQPSDHEQAQLPPTWALPKPSSVFQHVQSTPSTTWVIEHWLGRYPVVDVYVDNNGEKRLAVPLNVVVDSMNKCTVYFSQPQSGLATVG